MIKDIVDYKEIVYANLIVKHKKNLIELKKVVYKNEGDNMYKRLHNLKQYKIKEPVEIVGIKVISRLGFEHKNTGYTTGVRNEEKRNNITGAYE